MKQEDALSDLSNILGELKGMAVDMGTELDRCVLIFLEKNIMSFTNTIISSVIKKEMK